MSDFAPYGEYTVQDPARGAGPGETGTPFPSYTAPGPINGLARNLMNANAESITHPGLMDQAHSVYYDVASPQLYMRSGIAALPQPSSLQGYSGGPIE